MTRNYIFIILILTTLVFVSPAAASPYANILEDPTRSTEDKLADFAAAIGWRDDLGTYQMEMANYEMQVAAQEAEIAEAKQLQQELTATFGLDASRLAEQAETVDIPTAPYTEAEIAALDAESAAYYSAFAANYVATAAFPGGGSGTAADPYIITNRAELEAINDDLTAHYKLANNIDLGGSATPWITIADRYAPFTGVLDGSGYKISNIYMDEGGVSANKMSGLLGGLGVGAHIYDIGITGTGVNMGLGGLLYGINTGGIVDRCYARGEVEVGLGQMAGLLGGNSYGSGAKLRDCYAIGSVSNTGGVASVSASILQGSNYAGTVERCYAQGDVVSKNYASGLIGGGIHNLGQAYCRNSVSLASTLSAGSTESTFTGRVGGTYYQYFQNVYAAADMTLNGATISGGTTTNHNGADVSPETYHTQAFWQNTLGWDFTNTWYWDTTDQLPKLRAFLHGPTITSVSANPTTGGVDTEITLSATVTDATSMQWQYSTNGGGSWQDIVGANAATATWTPGATGSYEVRLQATNSDGTTTSDTVSVIIYAAPTVSATVSPTAGPVQQMLTLTGSVTDPAPGTTAYQWQSAPAETGEWTDISGATALTYQYAYDGAPGTTWYRLAATGTGGTAYSTAVSYTAYAMPTVTAAVTPDQGPLTQSLTLSAVINDPGPGETTYQWQTSSNGGTTWTSIDGAITNPYTYTFTGSAGQHQFRIIATGTGGSAASDPVTYTAIAPPVFSTATVSPSTGTYPLVVTFTADATDTTAYQWQMSENNGQTWTDIASTATGQYTHATPGTYLWRVTATGIGGTTTSETITITVTSPPPVFSSVSVSPLAGGLNQEFTLTAAAADTTGYQWQSAPTGSTSWTNIATGATATYTFPAGTTEGTYQIRVVATGPGGTTTSDPINVVISDYAPGIQFVSVTPATGDVPLTVTMSVTATNNPTYQWQSAPPGSTSWTNIATGATATYTFNSVGTYQIRVVATNEYGSATSAAQTVTATPPVPVITQAIVSPTAGAVPLTVVLSAAATNNPTYTWELLRGSTWTTIATGAAGSYTFGTDVPTGQYDIRITASNAYGIDTKVFSVSIVGMPTVRFVSPTDGSEHGAGRAITFSAEGTGSVYEWSFGDGTTTTGQTVQHAYQSVGSYTARVTASNAAGSASASVQIVIVEASDILLTVSEISSRGALLTAEIEQTPVPAGTKVWFEVYSPTGQTIWKSTKENYTTPHISTTVSGMPLLSGQSYTVRAFADGYAPSMRQSMTLIAAIAPPYDPMGKTLEESGLLQDPFNVSRLMDTLPGVLGQPMGGGKLGVSIAFGVIIMFVLTALWLRQNDIVMPTLLGLIMGFFLVDRAPPEFGFIGYPLMIVCGVGLVYALFKKR